MPETSGSSPSPRIALLLGVVFGLGFLGGFLTASSYNGAQPGQRAQYAQTPIGDGMDESTGAETFPIPSGDIPVRLERYDADVLFDSELLLEEHELGEDENGLFVYGTIFNRSSHAYDAVRVTFDLCDGKGQPYSGITDITHDRMEPGDSWGFTIYIPYTEMDLFSSYRLQSIMGTAK